MDHEHPEPSTDASRVDLSKQDKEALEAWLSTPESDEPVPDFVERELAKPFEIDLSEWVPVKPSPDFAERVVRAVFEERRLPPGDMARDTTGAPPHAVSLSDARTARRMVMVSDVPQQDVDDITQEVLCVLAFHREPLEVTAGHTPAHAREAFLWRVTVWQLAEHARRQARLQIGDGLCADVLWPRPAPSAEELSLAFAPIGTLHRALAKLQETEPELHAVLELSADGTSISAAAAVLEIPAGTACSRLRRAREAVRVFFQQEAADVATAARTAFLVAKARRPTSGRPVPEGRRAAPARGRVSAP